MSNRQIRALQRAAIEENKNWSSSLVEIPKNRWPERMMHVMTHGIPIRVLRSNRFIVQVFEAGEHLRLSVNRSEIDDVGKFRDGISWDELQTIKSEVGYGDRWGLEIFPARDEVVNVSNMRHLWLLPIHDVPPFAWRKDQ